MTRPPFVLGITMAGAVSAGAYAAGVLDFLFRALDAHNRNAGPDDAKVVVKAMSGASAGAVSLSLAAVGLLEGLRPRDATYAPRGADALTYTYALRALHEIWVERLRLHGEGGMLDTRDLRSRRYVSALNSDPIDEAVAQTLLGTVWEAPTHGFLANELDLFLTVTSLAGVPFVAPFRPGAAGSFDGHGMTRHALARHFRIPGAGDATAPAPWLDAWRDGGLPLPRPDEGLLPFDKPGSHWCWLKDTAVASGAFPVGLAARRLTMRPDELGPTEPGGAATGGAWPMEIDPELGPRPAPAFREGLEATGRAGSFIDFHVDGGVANNEPFEYARYAIRKADGKGGLLPNPRKAHEADRAVLMVDPFPEGAEWAPRAADDVPEMTAVGTALLSVLKNQARFKPQELALASSEDVHSRFLIAPSRTGGATGRRQGAGAIASGCLGGFSGFFCEDFRRHDFLLGQHNCRSFLDRHFKLDKGNPVFVGRENASETKELRNVVNLAPGLPDAPEPAWPTLSRRELDEDIKTEIATRLGAVISGLTLNRAPGALARLYLSFGLNNGGLKAAREAVFKAIEGEEGGGGLRGWGLLD